jgi:hypothetical protein
MSFGLEARRIPDFFSHVLRVILWRRAGAANEACRARVDENPHKAVVREEEAAILQYLLCPTR